MLMATEAAINKAREQGMAMGATVNTGHYGSAGHYVYRAMEEGMIAFSVQGNPTARGRGKIPPEQRRPSAYWGNPPFCFGFPSQDEAPLVLDMATCILGDDQRGEQYDALQELIPAAFFKSMGPTGVAQALGGTFVGGRRRARSSNATEVAPRLLWRTRDGVRHGPVRARSSGAPWHR